MKELIKVRDEFYRNYVYDIIDTDEVDDVEGAAAALAYKYLYFNYKSSEEKFDDNWDFDLYLLEDTTKNTEELTVLLRKLGACKFLEEYGA